MKTLPADLEALMPEPAEYACINGVAQDIFTADQVREAIRGATERAAAICDNIEDGAEFVGDTRAARTAEGCAAAIRSGGEAGS